MAGRCGCSAWGTGTGVAWGAWHRSAWCGLLVECMVLRGPGLRQRLLRGFNNRLCQQVVADMGQGGQMLDDEELALCYCCCC